MESLTGIPTVLVGLLIYMLLSRSGPLGPLGLLYTPQAIVLGQAVLVTPLLVATCYGAIRPTLDSVGELALTLGASELQRMALVMRESAGRVAASLALAFSRALGELGVALMLGGNIRGHTRVFSTAIALSVSMGDFEEAVQLGLLLLAVETALIAAARLLHGLEK